MQKRIESFDKTKLNYDIQRRSENFLIFLHGAGGSLSAWNKERNFFHKKNISTIAIDLRGHGLSDRPKSMKDYEIKNFSKDVYEIIKKENIKKPIIIGHCFGGIVTIKFHELFPNIAKAYILISTYYKAPKSLKKIFNEHFLLKSLFNFYLEHCKVTYKKSHENYSRFIGTNDYDFKRILSDINHTSIQSWIFTFENLSKFNGRKIVKKIRKPVLIIEGENDTIIKVSLVKKMKELIKKAILKIIPNENHIIILNNPKILEKEIYKFIERIH